MESKRARLYRKGTGLNAAFTGACAKSRFNSRGVNMAQTILVVDDDPVQRRLLEAAISRSGMQVVTAPGGQPDIDLINGPRGDQITLILLDLVMPDMGGVEACRRIRQSRPQTPVVFISGYSDQAVTSDVVQAEKAVLLPKPFDADSLLRAVRTALGELRATARG
jgi:CheY-like chemotaxis protein